MSIDTHLDATSSDITASAIKIGNLKTTVDNSIDHLANARKDAGSLEGESATGAQNLIDSAVKTCEGMVKDLTNYKNALDNLASGLTSIGSSLAGIREQATAGGLTVSGELVLKPEFTEQQPSGDADEKTLVAYFAVSSYEQYQKDAQDPSLGEGKKVTRAATTGTTTAVGGWAGGWAGAQVGATVGAFVGGPAGAAIGGVVGGIAGGIAGSSFGKSAGNMINSWFK